MKMFESGKATRLWDAADNCDRAASFSGWGAGGAGTAYVLSLLADQPLLFALAVAAPLGVSALFLAWLAERFRDSAGSAYRTDYQDWWDAKMRAEENPHKP